mgnify:CR=1 FL=1|jgi:hypothetical protein
MMTQAQRILEHLQSGKVLNRLNSWSDLGILEAPARVSELRALGHQISTKRTPILNRYGEKVSIAEWSL